MRTFHIDVLPLISLGALFDPVGTRQPRRTLRLVSPPDPVVAYILAQYE